MKVVFTTTILICMMLIASIAWSGIIYVPANQPTIQAGIDAAVNGDTVLVADGIYTGEGNVNLDFKGKAITVKSEGGAENCVIDCENKPGTRGFYFHNFEGPDSILDGFTIQNGNVSDGGGVYCYNSDLTIMNNIITGNSVSGQGGGIRCHYLAEVRIINNIITGNSAGQGGGIACQNASPTMMNNTIVGNSAGEGGGLYGYYSGPKITNTIIWDNNPQQIYLDHVTLTVSHSDVEGGRDGIGGVIDGLHWTSNINADPLFVDAALGDYHLQADSPCINAGTLNGAPETDIEGNPRNELPDIGAYEFIIVDTTPPEITLGEPIPSILWPPNHKFVDVIIIGIAFDICDINPDIDVSVEVIDAESGDGGPEHEPDFEIVSATIDEDGIVDIVVSLRAESSGKGDGRTYSITATVTDESGNSGTDTAEVFVPHDKGGGKKK